VVAIMGDTGGEANRELAASWRSLGLNARTLTPNEALERLRAGDVVLGRVDVRPTLDGLRPGLLELLELGHRGVLVLNRPSALLAAHDKLLTWRCLTAAGVPHPRTVHLGPGSGPPRFEPPYVVKPRFGSWGMDVVRCGSRSELRDVLAALSGRSWLRHGGALVQELVSPVGYDLRVLVAGGEVVGASERVAAPGEWRTNISLGGSYRDADAPPEARRLAVEAIAAVGLDLGGADLLPTPEGHVVVEVNGAVDFDERYSLPGREVHEDVAVALGLLPGC
jgi:[lysine-biosynthesis-protein LysW]--L-2-aminoadipate ligase